MYVDTRVLFVYWAWPSRPLITFDGHIQNLINASLFSEVGCARHVSDNRFLPWFGVAGFVSIFHVCVLRKKIAYAQPEDQARA
jgi:hypothetical protein